MLLFVNGLSYSKFKYQNLKVESDTIRKGENISLSVEIQNESDFDGVEIVQLYINDLVSEVVRPNRELKDFKRVFIKARSTVKINFLIDEEKLKYYHTDGSFYADCGEFEILVGSDSNTSDSIRVKLVD